MSGPLFGLIGREVPLDEVSRTLRRTVEDMRPAGVGAHHVTCSDESEFECVDVFQREFTRVLLPPLKFSERTAFRTASLGGRYEPGSVQLAEQHFATPETAASFKIVLIKINAHVSSDGKGRYGKMQRYGMDSVFCGAIRGLLDGAPGGALDALRETFASGGIDRLAFLRERVDEPLRPMAAAVAGASLQARRAVDDIGRFEPLTPTEFIVVPCVTINREHHDTELLCGIHHVGRGKEDYSGLGDDPAAYRFAHEGGLLRASIHPV